MLVFSTGLVAHTAATTFNTTNWSGELEEGTGVLKSLRPASNTSFDFSPSDVWVNITADRTYHTGDLNLRWQDENGRWTDGSTAWLRNTTFKDLGSSGGAVQTWDISASFPTSGLQITRQWSEFDGDVVLSFNVTNSNSTAVTVGGLGMPMEVNNIFSHREAIDTINTCSFIEPYIGLQAGYARVTSLTGKGPNMIATPLNGDTKLEAWNFLYQNVSTYTQYQTAAYEGNFAWEIYTGGYSDSYWAGTEQWNDPTALTLQPGESKTFGVRFSPAGEVQDIEADINNLGLPTVIGLPSYVLARDVVGSMYVNHSSPVKGIQVCPDGALTFGDIDQAPAQPWTGYSVTPSSSYFGRAKVLISYEDGITQSVHYWVGDSATDAITKYGQFLSNNQWYTNEQDPWRRGPSFMTYQRTSNDFVLQDARTWIAGLMDEAGAGPWVGLGLKQVIQPDAGEIDKLETFINKTVWGTVQHTEGDTKYGVQRSLFYYQPDQAPAYPGYTYSPEFAFLTFSNAEFQTAIDRSFNYVWLSILYWSMYRVGRESPGVLQQQSGEWYLQQAYHTVNFTYTQYPNGDNHTSSTDQGLMGSSLWGYLIDDLRYEDMSDEAGYLVDKMQEIQAYWAAKDAPYGSEQPWDCTAQESVYYWSVYFNDSASALKTVDSVHGFDHAIPHWGYNGNARRYWDFGTAGQYSLSRSERQIHHYGSAFNSIPLLDWYRRSEDHTSPSALYDLRVGYGGHSAALSNIAQDGFGSMAFHAWPDTLKWDNYTGDYGPSFVGHFLSSSSFLVNFPEFGWHAFGGNLEQDKGAYTVWPTAALARRFFVAEWGLDVQIDVGRVHHYTFEPEAKTLYVAVEADSVQSVLLQYRSYGSNQSVSLQGDWQCGTAGCVLPTSSGQQTTLQFTV